MRNILDIYESEMIVEAISEPHLRELEQQCKSFNIKFGELLQNFYRSGEIDWDKIDKDDIKIETDSNKNKIYVRSLRAGKSKFFKSPNVLILGVYDGIYKYVYNPYTDTMVEFTGKPKNHDTERYYQRTNAVEVMNNMTATAKIDTIGSCSEVVYIDFTDKMTYDIHRARTAARDGYLQMSDKDHKTIHTRQGVLGQDAGGLKTSTWGDEVGTYYRECMNIAKNNITRYKNILSKRKLMNIETTEVDKMVEQAYKTSLKISILFSKRVNAKALNYSDPNYHQIVKCQTAAQRELTNILNKYQRYMDLFSKIKHEGDKAVAFADGKNYASYYSKDLNNLVEEIKESLKSMTESLTQMKSIVK